MRNQTQNPQQSAQSQNAPGQQGAQSPGQQGNDRQDDATRQPPQRQTPGGSEEEE
ncbi:hypothetical protein [Luteimonas terrae]|uniref:Lana protein n=1 Tax=Luteimonas terrae TaxID=1530191 RepID=A0ABU1XUD3_9GAMM|nr:hypothetical protein [Luteimonas terrae]MDR7192376.1 hypothetical protein [Luteimonas terrae]